MRLNQALTSGCAWGAQPRTKKILIYDASPHPLSDLNPAKCGPETTPRDRQIWATQMLKQVEQLPDVEYTPIGKTYARENMDTGEHLAPIQQEVGGSHTIGPEQA